MASKLPRRSSIVETRVRPLTRALTLLPTLPFLLRRAHGRPNAVFPGTGRHGQEGGKVLVQSRAMPYRHAKQPSLSEWSWRSFKLVAESGSRGRVSRVRTACGRRSLHYQASCIAVRGSLFLCYLIYGSVPQCTAHCISERKNSIGPGFFSELPTT